MSVVKLTIRQTEPREDDPPSLLVRSEIVRRETVAELVVTASDKGMTGTTTFSADAPVKSAWQDAEKIDVLTEEDKKEIYAYFQKLSRALLKEDAKSYCGAFEDMFGTLWGERKKTSGVYEGDAVLKAQEGMLKKLFSHEGHFVSLAKESDLVFQKYNHAVRISVKDSDILRAGVPEPERDTAGRPMLRFRSAVFIKLDGKWVFFGR